MKRIVSLVCTLLLFQGMTSLPALAQNNRGQEIERQLKDLEEGILAYDQLAEKSEKFNKPKLTEAEMNESMTLSFAIGQGESMMSAWEEQLRDEIGNMGVLQLKRYLSCVNELQERGMLESDAAVFGDREITKSLLKWAGYINQYQDEIEELSEVGGRGIPGMFIYEDEEKCFNQLSSVVSRMTPWQKSIYDILNGVCHDELRDYLHRFSRD